MARHLFFAITLIGIGVLLNSPAEAMSGARCEDQNANCLGRCPDPSGQASQNKCVTHCDRQATKCWIRAHAEERRWWRSDIH
jgi:hypothetical protein